jgi:hypothetical protein
MFPIAADRPKAAGAEFFCFIFWNFRVRLSIGYPEYKFSYLHSGDRVKCWYPAAKQARAVTDTIHDVTRLRNLLSAPTGTYGRCPATDRVTLVKKLK